MNGVSFNRLEQEMLYYHRWRSKTVILLFVYFLICVRISGEEVIGHDTAVEYGERANLLCHLTDTKEDITLIMWKKTTKRKTEEDIFFVIHQDDKTEHINGLGDRVQFIGSFAERNGSIQLRGMEFLDEGTYTCIFNLFPSGPIATYIKASVFARPAVTVKGEEPVIGCLEVILASCFASNARPAAEVTWRLGELEKSLKTRTNHTVNANETITVVSYLLGVPFKHLHKKNIQCVVKHNSLTEHLVLNYTIDIHYPPESVIIIPDSSTDVNEFRCIVDSNPQPTLKGYNWTRVNKSSQFFEGNRLPVPNMTPELNGLYICNASNKYGSALGSLYVNVHAEPSSVCWVLFVLLIIVGLAVTVGAIYKLKPGWIPVPSFNTERDQDSTQPRDSPVDLSPVQADAPPQSNPESPPSEGSAEERRTAEI
ncbi:poliovirus receptor isoform X3 [Danio rerio]|uniref:Nectin cell adhesion molecule 3 n=1 Tax=Danio rerio TaxID=7955 RepID=A0A8M3AW08_DANRE|nr:poliovirus receptor [Danio rerio]XP_021334566.1 poliovirus receptor [Danio rerio]|eukprot:XP_009302934.1 poliovirus receptor [Danio rerio]